MDASQRGRRNRRHGATKERQTIAWYREQGYVVTGNTHGAFDLIALKAGERPKVVEVKAGPSRYGNYPPRERAETIAAALQAGADALLAHWKPRAREPDLIHSDDWPRPKTGITEE